MEDETIPFVKQLLDKLEENVKELENAKKENDPREFSKLKENSFAIHEEIDKIL